MGNNRLQNMLQNRVERVRSIVGTPVSQEDRDFASETLDNSDQLFGFDIPASDFAGLTVANVNAILRKSGLQWRATKDDDKVAIKYHLVTLKKKSA